MDIVQLSEIGLSRYVYDMFSNPLQAGQWRTIAYYIYVW